MSESNGSVPPQPDLKSLKRMRGKLPVRPLKSKHTGQFYAWEAYAGAIPDPRTGELRKQRQAFNFNQIGSAEEALEKAKAWIIDMRKMSNADKSAVIKLPMPLRTSLIYIADACEKEGFDPVDMCMLGLETAKARKVAREIRFEEAARLVIAQKQKAGKSRAYLSDLRNIYQYFGRSFPRMLDTITAEEVEDWLDDCDVGPVTWNNYRRMLGVLFSFAARPRNGWVKENVISQIEQREVKTDEVTVLTVEQVKQILATAEREIPRLIPYLCLGMFAGLRRSEAAKTNWDDISWEGDGTCIRIKGGKMRSMTTRYVHLMPAFIDWMKPIAQREGPVCTGPYARRDDIRKLRELTFDFDGNIFRHTFGSYMLGMFNHPHQTAAMMGHTSPQMLVRHYRKPVPEEIAQKFWGLTREAVLSADASRQG